MLVILGKNGSGKTFLANKLLDLGFYRSINCTTRPKRDGETDGRDYHFLTKEKFERLLSQGHFVEYKKRGNYYYGTPVKNLRKNTILLAGDLNKVRTISDEDVVPLYIDCDIEKRYERVKSRNDTKATIFNRFHDENFSYLYEFDGFFIDNSFENENALQRILGIIDSDGKIIDKSLIATNSDFISEKTKNFSDCCDDEILLFLKYEEHLLRKLMLKFDLRYINSYPNVLEYYYTYMDSYLRLHDIMFTRNSMETMSVKLNDSTYRIPFQKEKILRRK